MIIILYCLNQSKRLSLKWYTCTSTWRGQMTSCIKITMTLPSWRKKREEKKRNIQKSDDFFNNPIEHNIPWFFPFDI